MVNVLVQRFSACSLPRGGGHWLVAFTFRRRGRGSVSGFSGIPETVVWEPKHFTVNLENN